MNGLGKGNKALAIVVSALLASTLIMVMFHSITWCDTDRNNGSEGVR